MFSRKTVLLNITFYVFVSAKELKKRGFKFFKLLVHFDYDLTFRMYSIYIFKSNRWNLKQLFIYNKEVKSWCFINLFWLF